MRRIAYGLAVMVAVTAGGYWAFSERAAPGHDGRSGSRSALVAVTLPAEFGPLARVGERAFVAKCAACHGQNAAGVDGAGPPLVHKIYEPSHHADASFFLAVQNGVRSHHWGFGDMPPVEGLTRGDVKAIVAYVRELQRANGIN